MNRGSCCLITLAFGIGLGIGMTGSAQADGSQYRRQTDSIEARIEPRIEADEVAVSLATRTTAIANPLNIGAPLTQVRDPSTAWIRLSDLSEGGILAGFTLNESQPGDDPCKETENPTQLSIDCGVAASSHTNGLWYGGSPTYTARRWYEAPAWPSPSNFCDFYNCDVVQWKGYTYVAQALWPGVDDVAAMVVTGGSDNPLSDARFDEIAIVTSTDGGATFTKSKLITLTQESATNIDPLSIHASMHRDIYVGTLVDGKYTRSMYLVWKNRNTDLFQEPIWWTTTIEVGLDGHFIQTRKPRQLDIVPSHVERVTIQSYFFDNFGDDHFVDVAYAEILDENDEPAARPDCPSEKPVRVKWWLTRTPEYHSTMKWYCQASNIPCTDRRNLLAVDEEWRACVGSGWSPEGNPWTKNDERVAYTVNETFPRAVYAAINRSVPEEDNRMRVHLYEYHFDSINGTDPLDWVRDYVTTGSPDEDHYGQQQSMQKGVGWPANSSMLTYSFMVSNNDDQTHIRGMSSPAPSSLLVDHWTPGMAPLSSLPFWTVRGDSGAKHGVTAQQLCVDNSAGQCPGISAVWPGFRFFAAWPETAEEESELFGLPYID